MKRVSIFQPYLPAYRVEFFERLVETLRDDDIAVRVIAGQPAGAQALRGDAAQAPWMVPVATRDVKVPGGTLKLGSGHRYIRGNDGVIVGLQGTSLDVYLALLSRTRVGLWGHVDSYVRDWNSLDQRLEQWQMRHADRIFAYTPRGADYALRHGVVADRITTVMNAVPTESLEEALRRTSEEDVARFRSERGIGDRPTLAYVGGLDESKRIDFLARSLDLLQESRPDVHLLVAGQGADAQLLDPAAERGQITRFPHADDELKALLFRSSDGIANPGRIGLIAVDALVAGLPVLTTRWKYHAPEAEYLVEGRTRISSENSPAAYAALVDRFTRQRHTPLTGLEYPTMSRMVANFADGVRQLIA